MYLKSLDHMGIQIKAHDKKNLSSKYIIDLIKTKREEQMRLREGKGRPRISSYQFEYELSDKEVITDVLRIMVIFINHSNQHSGAERRRISEFFEKFIPAFFGLSDELVTERIQDIERGTPDDDADDVAAKELPNGRGRRPVNGKKNDLRRGVLDRGRNGTRGRGQKEGSATGSKESTPDVDSVVEDEVLEGSEDQAATEVTNIRWTGLPHAAVYNQPDAFKKAEDRMEWDADKAYVKKSYNLYGNGVIYTFFTVFQTLYRRFKDIKNCEEEAVAEGIRAKTPKPAKDIGLLEEKTDLYWGSTGETYYARTLSLVEDFVMGELEEAKFQDYLRHYYLQKGWQLYTVIDLLKNLCRLGAACSTADPKEKTPDLLEQFYQDRELKEISYNGEINLRKFADKYLKDAELFVIKWVRDLY
jgi:paired amphipathic helix protein Sin3a